MTEDEMVGWLHRLSGHEFEQALGDGEGQGSLVCCSLWRHKQLDMTERRNNHHHLFVTCLTYILFLNYLSLAALGLCGCVPASSSCSEQELLFIAVRWLLLWQSTGSGAQLESMGSVFVAHGRS